MSFKLLGVVASIQVSGIRKHSVLVDPQCQTAHVVSTDGQANARDVAAAGPMTMMRTNLPSGSRGRM